METRAAKRRQEAKTASRKRQDAAGSRSLVGVRSLPAPVLALCISYLDGHCHVVVAARVNRAFNSACRTPLSWPGSVSFSKAVFASAPDPSWPAKWGLQPRSLLMPAYGASGDNIISLCFFNSLSGRLRRLELVYPSGAHPAHEDSDSDDEDTSRDSKLWCLKFDPLVWTASDFRLETLILPHLRPRTGPAITLFDPDTACLPSLIELKATSLRGREFRWNALKLPKLDRLSLKLLYGSPIHESVFPVLTEIDLCSLAEWPFRRTVCALEPCARLTSLTWMHDPTPHYALDQLAERLAVLVLDRLPNLKKLDLGFLNRDRSDIFAPENEDWPEDEQSKLRSLTDLTVRGCGPRYALGRVQLGLGGLEFVPNVKRITFRNVIFSQTWEGFVELNEQGVELAFDNCVISEPCSSPRREQILESHPGARLERIVEQLPFEEKPIRFEEHFPGYEDEDFEDLWYS